MIFAIITLLTALSMAGIAAWISVTGLMAIFSGAPVVAATMGVAIELGKLVAASWLYRHWNVAPWFQKIYMGVGLAIMLVITSAGIFGYLSKAYLEKSAVTGSQTLDIELLQQQISRDEKIIADSNTVIAQLDGAVDALVKNQRIRGRDGAIAVRESQRSERAALNAEITAASDRLSELRRTMAKLKSEKLAMEVELGPITYMAELIYGDQAANYFGSTVRGFILLLILIFDPMALSLLLAANQTMMMHGRSVEIQYKSEPQNDSTLDNAAENVDRIVSEPARVFAPKKKDEHTRTEPSVS